MIRLTGLIIAFIICLSFVKRRQIDYKNNTVVWSKERKLTWDDYWGKPPLTSKFAAVSSLDIKYKSKTKKDTLFYTLINKVDKNTSWVYPVSKKSRLLIHEQTHFNILELYCRKIREHISKMSINKKEYKQVLARSYANFYKQYQQTDSIYDKETNFSNNIPIQEKWNNKIDTELIMLEKYSDTLMIKMLK